MSLLYLWVTHKSENQGGIEFIIKMFCQKTWYYSDLNMLPNFPLMPNSDMNTEPHFTNSTFSLLINKFNK